MAKLKLTVQEFRQISFERKLKMLYSRNWASYLCHRKIGESTVFLYNVNNFFVEAFYSFKRADVTMINCFTGTAELEQYFSSIQLTELKPILKF